MAMERVSHQGDDKNGPQAMLPHSGSTHDGMWGVVHRHMGKPSLPQGRFPVSCPTSASSYRLTLGNPCKKAGSVNMTVQI